MTGLSYTRINDYLIIHIGPQLTTNTSPELEIMVDNLIAEGNEKIIFDLSDTRFVSSAGLRIFLKTAKNLKHKEGAFALSSVDALVMDVIKTGGFDRFLTIVDEPKDAFDT